MKIAITFNLKSACRSSPRLKPSRINFGWNLKNQDPGLRRDDKNFLEDTDEEFDAPETIEAIGRVLTDAGHEVVSVEADQAFLKNIQSAKPDFVFNLAEGYGGPLRESYVPMILESLGIPHSGSNGFTLALSLDKALTKMIARNAGVRTPDWTVIPAEAGILKTKTPAFAGITTFPSFLKPLREGSSKGIRLSSLVRNTKELEQETSRFYETYGEIPLILEKFIPGPEITVGALGTKNPKVMGMMQISWKEEQKKPFIYSLEVKRDWKKLVEYQVPPAIPKKTKKEIEEMAMTVHRALECRDISRVDFRLDKKGRPYFIEINPLPGLSPEYSDLVIMMRKLGMSYATLILSIMDHSLRRSPELTSAIKH